MYKTFVISLYALIAILLCVVVYDFLNSSCRYRTQNTFGDIVCYFSSVNISQKDVVITDVLVPTPYNFFENEAPVTFSVFNKSETPIKGFEIETLLTNTLEVGDIKLTHFITTTREHGKGGRRLSISPLTGQAVFGPVLVNSDIYFAQRGNISLTFPRHHYDVTLTNESELKVKIKKIVGVRWW